MNSKILLIVLFFFPFAFANPKKEDFCKKFNEQLKINRQFLHLSFKDKVYLGKKEITEAIPFLEKEIADLELALNDKAALLKEQESILKSEYLMASFDEKIAALKEKRMKIETKAERNRLQNKLMQKLNDANLVYLDVTLGKYKQRDVKDRLNSAKKAENKINTLKAKLLLSDVVVLLKAKQHIDKQIKKLSDEKARLKNMIGNELLMIQEASKNKKNLLMIYKDALAKAHTLRNDSKKLVKSMKVDSLKNIYNTIHQARQLKCTINYVIE